MPLLENYEFFQIQDMVHKVRAIGRSAYFMYRPLVRLRALANGDGRATTDDKTLALLVSLPHRPFRIVLSFWSERSS